MLALHINTSTSFGGAAIAAYRLVEAMILSGIDARLLAKTGISLPYTKILGNQPLDKILDYLQYKFVKTIRKPNHSISIMTRSTGIEHLELVKRADIIYLHWINNFLGFNDIDWLLNNKKQVVWYLHDMWPLTGICHHSLSCNHYLTGCNDCPQLKINKCIALWHHRKKINHWRNADNLTIVTPSKWMAKKAEESSIFGGKKVVVCPNLIDTSLYIPTLDNSFVKKELGLDPLKKYILFGAAVGAKNVYKGMEYLYNAFKQVDCDYGFISMGVLGNDYPRELIPRTHQMGFVESDLSKVKIYQASDVFVIPSIAENFPNMVIEAMACGVPVVGFRVGGIVEQITHKHNGFLAETAQSDSLAEGIEWVLKADEIDELQHNCREYVEKTCSYANVIDYHKVLLKY